jgi:type I restriction enzyme S subunit
MKPYPKTKPSGVEWLGEVPEHWGAVALKRYARRYAGGTPDRNNEAYWEAGTIPWINSGAVNQGLINEPSAFITQEGYANSSARYVPKNALVMALAGQGKTKGMIAQMGIEATCNQSMAAICPAPPIQNRYLFWLLASQYEQIRNMAGGEQRDGLNLEILGNIPCLLPVEAEQIAIAAYLDRETGRIDELVGKKRELIERLKEKRTALISRTVTRGLPADLPPTTLAKLEQIAGEKLPLNPPLKASGIEWLGDVPEHWGAKKLGYGAWLQGGYAFASDKFDSEGVPVVRMNNLKRGVLDTSQASCISPENCLDAFALEEGDLLWGMSGSIGETGSLGNFARVRKTDLPAQLNQRVGRFQIIGAELSLNFLTYIIQTKFFYDQIMLFVTGTAQFNVSSVQVQSVFMPFPPLPEQIAIAAYLDEETAKLDALVAKVETAIERLQEYRTALITAAVTGKIDVRS